VIRIYQKTILHSPEEYRQILGVEKSNNLILNKQILNFNSISK